MPPRHTCLAALALTTLPLGAQDPPKVLRAPRTATAPRIDGRLEEAAWAEAPVLRDFTQLSPALGQPSQKATEVRILFDDRFLYVGAWLRNPKGAADVVRQVHRRDQVSASDWFAIFIDSAHDHRTATSFMVNAANVQRDGLHFEDGTEDWGWDGVWDSAVTVDATGWRAELRIPLSLLRLHRGATWGVNFARRDEGSAREASYWYAPPRSESTWVSRFHHLEGLEQLRPQLRREWIPYLSLQRKFETAQAWDDRAWTTRAGLDAHFGLSAASQLDLTLRPDFGQVEVDQAVINLTTVETFFPEKRPFFLEGMEIFQVPGVRLFHSRRIGPGLPGPDPDLKVQDWPLAVEIAAAAKYTAKLPGGLALGLLGAGMETARGTLQGSEDRPLIYPRTNVALARLTQSLDDRGSYLGAFGSSFWQTGGGRRAEVGALDGAWQSPQRTLRLEGVMAHSEAGTQARGASGDMVKLRVKGALGGGWVIDGNAFTVSRAFNPNDLGYLDRPDRRGFTFDLDKHWDRRVGPLRNPMWRFNYVDFRDQAGRPYLQYVESWAKTEFHSNWVLYAGHGRGGPMWDDRELRTFRLPQKKYLRYPSLAWTFLGFESPANGTYVVTGQWNHVPREGGPKDEVQCTQTFKPFPRLEVRLETAYNFQNGQWHWMETQGETPLVGTRKLSQFDQILRIAYAPSPTLTFQVFAQWLAATWAFRDPRTWVDESTLAPGAHPTVPLAQSDRLWNLNLITRWAFRPGCSLYLVATHGAWTGETVNDRGTLSPWRDLARMRELPSDDAVQVKVSWLFR